MVDDLLIFNATSFKHRGSNMNSKDTLKRVQQDKKDEREEQIKTKAFNIGWLTVTVVLLLLIILRHYFNEQSMDLMMILMAQSASYSFYIHFKLRKQNGYLAVGIISTIAFFLSLAALLSQYEVY